MNNFDKITNAVDAQISTDSDKITNAINSMWKLEGIIPQGKIMEITGFLLGARANLK